MSDYTISLVPKVSRCAFDEVVVNDILKWLVSKDIVKAELSNCILGNLGYAISDGAQYVVFEPQWGFSNLGFTFWNWPELKPEFIVELQGKLNCSLAVVRSHI